MLAQRIFGLWSLIILSIGLCLSGCLPSTQAGPQRLFDLGDEKTQLKAQLSLPDFNAYNHLSELDQISFRNNYVAERMYAIDLEYSDYEASLTQERQRVGFASDVVNIGLTSASALSTGAALKTILAETASGLTGVRSAYTDDILLNRTVDVLQIQMRADRNLVASHIIAHLKTSPLDYTLAAALSELEEYYQAGTLNGALRGVSSSATISADIAQVTKENALTSNSFAHDKAAEQLRTFVLQNGIFNTQRAAQLRALLIDLGIKSRLSEVLGFSELLPERQRLFAAAKAKGLF